MFAQYAELRPINGFVTAATSLNGSQPNFALCSAICWPGTLYIHFRQLLPPDGILPRAKFSLSPSMYHCTSLSGYIFETKACMYNQKKTCQTAIPPPQVLIIRWTSAH